MICIIMFLVLDIAKKKNHTLIYCNVDRLPLCTGELGLILSGDSLSFSVGACCVDARALPLYPQDAEEEDEEEEGVQDEDVGPGGCEPAVNTKLSVSELSSREGEGEPLCEAAERQEGTLA